VQELEIPYFGTVRLAIEKMYKIQDLNLYIVPTIESNSTSHEREYLVINEKPDSVRFRDSGSIDKVYADNLTGSYILLPVGIVIAGLTQPRIIRNTIVLEPYAKDVLVDVMCVSASTPITPRAYMKMHRYAPLSVKKACRFSQRRVWSTIRAVIASSDLSSHDKSRILDNLALFMKEIERTKQIGKFLEDVQIHEGQVGFAVFDHEGIIALELFNHADSFKTCSKDILKKYVLERVFTKHTERIYDLNEDLIGKALNMLIKDLEKAEYKLIKKSSEHVTYEISGTSFEGQYAILKGKTIYMVVWRR